MTDYHGWSELALRLSHPETGDTDEFNNTFALFENPDGSEVPLCVPRELIRTDPALAAHVQRLEAYNPRKHSPQANPTMEVSMVLGYAPDQRSRDDEFADQIKALTTQAATEVKINDPRTPVRYATHPPGQVDIKIGDRNITLGPADIEQHRLLSADPDNPIWQQSPALAFGTIPPAAPAEPDFIDPENARLWRLSQGVKLYELNDEALLRTESQARRMLISQSANEARIIANLRGAGELTEDDHALVADTVRPFNELFVAVTEWHDRVRRECLRRGLVIEAEWAHVQSGVQVLDGQHR